jgi:D-sedoheptulose 7-phosphate isomerase
MTVIAFTGNKDAELHGYSDIILRASSSVTSHVQECHLVMIHILCGIVEDSIFAG